MRQQELEIRAREAVESLRQGHPVEASVFELKADWIDPPKAAERLAGHANAARGEPFIWLFGISETDGTVPGVQAAELADWWHQVQACFDEHVAPEMEHCLTLVDEASGNTFVAMSFVGDRAPYLVKSQKGGFPERIVPWREATGMRAASRSQLL